jgi:hypothetical protein
MRKKDIHIGSAYAVVGSTENGCEYFARKAVIVKEGSIAGWWQVRFEEPVFRGAWARFYLPGKDKSQPVSREHEVDSRCILAPWDAFAVEQKRVKAVERAEKNRLAAEQEHILALLAELESALGERGFDVSAPGFVALYEVRQLGERGKLTRANVFLTEELLAHVVEAVKESPVPVRTSAVAALLDLETI